MAATEQTVDGGRKACGQIRNQLQHDHEVSPARRNDHEKREDGWKGVRDGALRTGGGSSKSMGRMERAAHRWLPLRRPARMMEEEERREHKGGTVATPWGGGARRG